jgi:hypothetical protein
MLKKNRVPQSTSAEMGFFSMLPKLVPNPAVFKQVAKNVPKQVSNRALKAQPPPALMKTTPPSALETLGNSKGGRAVLSAKTATVGLVVGGGAA